MSTKKTTTEKAVLDTAISAAATETAKGAKVTTFEELWKGHTDLPRTERGAIILTDELFHDVAASHLYSYKGREFKVLEKRSGTERGGKTLYKVKSGADIFTDFSIEELKQEFKCEYRRPKNGSSNCTTPLGKLLFLVSKKETRELAESCKDEEVTMAYKQLLGIVGKKREIEKKREDEERERKNAEAKAKAKTERADKNVSDISDDALARELARRTGISLEDARKMLQK